MNTGNFLQVAETQHAMDVGFGKMFLIYDEKQALALSDLTAAAINAHIADGTIIGVIKNWSMVAGASVAETNVERQGTGEMRQIRAEILADTLTFENNISNNKVFTRLSKKGTVYGVLVDDMGNAFGELSTVPNSIETMMLNFSGKVSTGLQNDRTNEKTVAITVRYLVKEIGFVAANIEVEEIESKTPLILKLSSTTSQSTSAIVFIADLYNETTGELLTAFTTTSLDIDAAANGVATTPSAVFGTNQLTVTLAKTVANFSTTSNNIKLQFSTPEYYLTDVEFTTTTA